MFPLTSVDDDFCIRAALLDPLTRAKGRGIGDRLWHVLATRSLLSPSTADAAWKEISAGAGVKVQLIR